MRTAPTVRLAAMLACTVLLACSCSSGQERDRNSEVNGNKLGQDAGAAGATEVYTAWWAALGRGDGTSACALMDTDGKTDMDDFGTAGSCENAVRIIHGYIGEPDRRAIQQLDVPASAVEVDGDEARIDQTEVTSAVGEWDYAVGHDILRYDAGRWWIHDINYG